jgi:hypothetical protein
VLDLLPGVRMVNLFGQTEGSPITCLTPGRQDADGYVYLVGRTHDRIVRGGENVYPAEVEHVIESHPGVKAAGVVGVPDERLGQTIAAFVVPSDAGDPPDAAGLRRCARGGLLGSRFRRSDTRSGRCRTPRPGSFSAASSRPGTTIRRRRRKASAWAKKPRTSRERLPRYSPSLQLQAVI